MTTAALDLYWIPLGAGTPIVQVSGRAYEAIRAVVDHRPRYDLYHAALIAETPEGPTTIEMTPIPRRSTTQRGVVAEGPVGSRLLAGLRVFRYEIRRWPGGAIPDLAYAVGGPTRLTGDSARVHQVLDVLLDVPTPVWGRDELRTGEMWNSNSVIAWALTRAALIDEAGQPPDRGRAPGWHAGVEVARRR